METYMKKKNKTQSVTGLLFGFMERVSGDHVGAYATQAAYFLIMSFIPCILFLTTLVRYTPLTYNVVRDAIVAFIPENLQSFVLGIVVDVYKRSTAIVPLSAIVALWSAGKGMQSIINGLNTIYHVKLAVNQNLCSILYFITGDCGNRVSAYACTRKRNTESCIKIYSFSWKSSGKNTGGKSTVGIWCVVSGFSYVV